nr:hypothetical protein [Tanacetum cinerariifolium]
EQKERELKYIEKIKTLKFYNESNNKCIEILKKELELIKKEKEGVDGKLEGFLTASKDLDNIIESQRSDKNKEGLRYSDVLHPIAQIYSSPKKDLVAEDVYVKVGTFHFSADSVVVDFDVDPRVPLILRRYFLKTGRPLIYVFKGELTLHVGKEAITFNLDQTSRYSANYNDMTAKRIDVIDMACEEYSDFLLEEVDAFLAIEDDPTSSEVDQSYLDSEGDILLLEAFLNDDPSLTPQNQGNYLPEVRKELKICEAKFDKSLIDEPPDVKLKDLPPHLEYAFLEGDDKSPVIIAKDLSMEEKIALITVLKSHKRAISWKLSDIKGMDLEFCTHKTLMEEDFKPTV